MTRTMHKLMKFLKIKGKETAEKPFNCLTFFLAKFKILLKHDSWKNNIFLNLSFNISPLYFYLKNAEF